MLCAKSSLYYVLRHRVLGLNRPMSQLSFLAFGILGSFLLSDWSLKAHFLHLFSVCHLTPLLPSKSISGTPSLTSCCCCLATGTTFLSLTSSANSARKTSETAQQINLLSAKSDDLNWFPPGITWWKERTNSFKMSSDLYIHALTCVHSDTVRCGCISHLATNQTKDTCVPPLH